MTHSILLVEDDSEIRCALKEALEDEGYRVATAGDGLAALQSLAGGPMPAVILLDLMMPRMDGFGFRETQLRDPRLAAIPVVVISADSGMKEKARVLGADGALRKPIDFDDLLGCLRAIEQRH